MKWLIPWFICSKWYIIACRCNWNKCIEIYELDLAHFLSAPGLAWQAFLKKTEVKLEILRNNDMLMMVEKGIIGGICHTIHRYTKANNNRCKQFVWTGNVSKIACKWF